MGKGSGCDDRVPLTVGGNAEPNDAAAEQSAFLLRNAIDSVPKGDLEKKLATGRKLRIKLGMDPTAPDIHLGHAVVLTKLREFQDLGHQVVLIIGDYTTAVGDPSGRTSSRPILSTEEINRNAQTYVAQATLILRNEPELLQIRHNSEWLDMSALDLFKLARTATVAQILEREDFRNRMEAEKPVSVLELLYPLLQGYDSVAIAADVEIGGSDQTFNILRGRDLQSQYRQTGAYTADNQCSLTMPILTGTDGVKKMGKSTGNYIGLTDTPADMYGKVMSIPDESMQEYYTLLFGEDAPTGHPRDAKAQLAHQIVTRFHDAAAADHAAAQFTQVFAGGGTPDDIEQLSVTSLAKDGTIHLPALVASIAGVSNSQARRLIKDGAVKRDGVPINELDIAADGLAGTVLQVGKRNFRQLI